PILQATWLAASVSSLGNSLLPTTVRFMPIWTDTGTPPISMVVLPLRYQPREPVENSFTSAVSGTSPIRTTTGLALLRNSPRLTGQLVFLAIETSLSLLKRGKQGPFSWRPSYHGRQGAEQERFRGGGFSLASPNCVKCLPQVGSAHFQGKLRV